MKMYIESLFLCKEQEKTLVFERSELKKNHHPRIFIVSKLRQKGKAHIASSSTPAANVVVLGCFVF